MIYWISLSFLFIFFVFVLFIIYKEKTKDHENNISIALIFINCIVLSIIIMMSIDIPSALNGGEEIYINELPATISCGLIVQNVYTDNDTLRQLRGANWNRYEKYGNYRIRYTKLTKIVLNVEKLD